MPYTSDSSQYSYITVDEFLARFDWRDASQLCSDDGETPVARADLYAHPRLLAALNDASGRLEAAIFASERYNAKDLQALDGVSRQYMLRLLKAIAAYNLWTARNAASPPETVMEDYRQAIEELQLLSVGKNIFSFDEVSKAGLPKVQQMQAADYWNDNYISSVWGARMFGPRAKDIRKRF